MTGGRNHFGDNLWLYLILPPVILNVTSLILYGGYYALYYTQPEAVAGASPSHILYITFLLIFIVEWSFTISILRKRKKSGKSIISLIAPGSHPWRFRWGPAILIFITLNALFAVYLCLANLVYPDLAASYQGVELIWRTLGVLLIPLTAAFCEELIWRGHILSSLEIRGYSPWRAILISATSFALIHGIFLPDKLVVTFLFGIAAGWYYLRERNLLVLMFSHWVLDLWSFGLFMFAIQ